MTVFLKSSWANSNGTDVTDGGVWGSPYLTGGSTLAVVTSTFTSDEYALQVNRPAGYAWLPYSFSSIQNPAYASIFFEIPTLNEGDEIVAPILFQTAGAGNPLLVYLRNNNGVYQWGINYMGSGAVWSTQQTTTPGSYVCVGIGWIGDPANAQAYVYINGNELTDIAIAGKTNNFGINAVIIGVTPDPSSSFDGTIDLDNAVIANDLADIQPGAPGTTYYTITASSDSHSTITPAGAVSVADGSSLTFNISAGTGYVISEVLVDGVDQGAVASYTFSDVTENHTISVTSTIPVYTEGGGLVGIWWQAFNWGASGNPPVAPFTLVETPAQFLTDFQTLKSLGFDYIVGTDYGYVQGAYDGNFTASAYATLIPLLAQAGLKLVLQLFPDDVEVGPWSTTLQNTWIPRLQQLAAWVNANGYANVILGVNIDNFHDDFGSSPPTIAVMNAFLRTNLGMPNLNIYYDQQALDFSQYGPIDANTFLACYDYNGPTAAMATWAGEISYNPTEVPTGQLLPILDCYSAGWLAANLKAQVLYCVQNGNMTKTIQYFSWFGANQLNSQPGQFAAIQAINLAYKGQTTTTTYTITASPDANSTITPSGSVTVDVGASQTFTIAAKSGYVISEVLVDGVDQGAVASYTFSDVTENHTISVTSTVAPPTTYTLQVYSTPAGATVTVNGTPYTTPITLSLAAGEITLQTPSSLTMDGTQYNFMGWDNGDNSESITVDLTADGEITAEYTVTSTFSLTLNSSPQGATIFIDGTVYTTPQMVTLSAGNHTVQAKTPITIAGVQYNFSSWDDTALTETPLVTFNLTADSELTAEYTAAPPTSGSSSTDQKIIIASLVVGTMAVAIIIGAKSSKHTKAA